MSKITKIIYIITLIICLQILNVDFAKADADIWYPPETPASIYLQRPVPVEMKKEKVIFNIKSKKTMSKEAQNQSYKKTFYADVTAIFNMFNNSDNDLEIDVSFPLVQDFVKNEGGYSNYPEEIRYLEDFEIFSNGVKKIANREEQRLKIDKEFLKRTFDEKISLNETYPVMVWKQEFPARKITQIVIKYKATAGEVWRNEYLLSYILSTGRSWDGSIGHGEIIYNFPIRVEKDLIVNPADNKVSYTIRGNTVRFFFEKLEPKISDNVRLFFYDTDSVNDLRIKEKQILKSFNKDNGLDLMDEYSSFISIFYKKKNDYYRNKKYQVAAKLLDIAEKEHNSKLVDEVLRRYFGCYVDGRYEGGKLVIDKWNYFEDIISDLNDLKKHKKDNYGNVKIIGRSCMRVFSRETFEYVPDTYVENILKRATEILKNIEPNHQRTKDAIILVSELPNIKTMYRENEKINSDSKTRRTINIGYRKKEINDSEIESLNRNNKTGGIKNIKIFLKSILLFSAGVIIFGLIIKIYKEMSKK